MNTHLCFRFPLTLIATGGGGGGAAAARSLFDPAPSDGAFAFGFLGSGIVTVGIRAKEQIIQGKLCVLRGGVKTF